MKLALLTQNSALSSVQRLVEEAHQMKFDLAVHSPVHRWVSSDQRVEQYEVTLNRLSNVHWSATTDVWCDHLAWGRQFNSPFIRRSFVHKSEQFTLLAKHGFHLIPWAMGMGRFQGEDWWQIHRWMKEHDRGHGWVLKLNRGQQGIGVNFLHEQNSVISWLETFYAMGDQDILLQPRIDIKREWRLTWLQGKVWALLQRTGSDKGNYHQGGLANEVKWQQAGHGVQSLGEKLVAKLDQIHYASVDIIEDNAGQLWPLEVNTCPGFEQLEKVTGRNFARELWQSCLC